MIIARAPLLLLACAATAGCGPSDTDPGPGGVTVGEARALDDAAAMIDGRRTPSEALNDEDDSPNSQESEVPADGA